MAPVDESPSKSAPNSPVSGSLRRSSSASSSPTIFFPFFREKHSKDGTIPQSLSRSRDSQVFVPLDESNKAFLLEHVTNEIQQLHPTWDQVRIRELASAYVQATKSECDHLIHLFSKIAQYDRTRGLIDDDETEHASIKYKPLLIIMEKLYVAVEELGFFPTEALERILLDLSFRVLPFDRFVAAIDQNILKLSEEFVTRVINELGDDPQSYAIKEQLIFMLPNINSDLHARLFSLIQNDRAKRMTAQLTVARSFSANLQRSSTLLPAGTASLEGIMDDIINQNESGTNSKLVEQAAVTFLRDCNQKGLLDDEQLSYVKIGLLSLVSQTPHKNI